MNRTQLYMFAVCIIAFLAGVLYEKTTIEINNPAVQIVELFK